MRTCKVVHLRKASYDKYIGRPSILGNPFEIGKDGTRKEVIRKFKEYAVERLKSDRMFRKAILDCEGKTIACWCKPQDCHGDVFNYLISKAKKI